MKEKTLLPASSPGPRVAKTEYSSWKSTVSKIILSVFTCISLWALASPYFDITSRGNSDTSAGCLQADPLIPQRNEELWGSLTNTYGTDEFKNRAIHWLSGAVRVPTESFDNMGPVGQDPRWDVFSPFHDYLLGAFPLVTHLTREDPLYSTLQCVAQHASDVSSDLRRTIKKSVKSETALRSLEKELFKNPVYKHLVGTTQAIDLVQGGVKANALPEQAWAIVNHRIAVISSVGEVQARDTKLLRSLAKKFNLTYEAFGKTITQDTPSSGSLVLSNVFPLEPAPVTPTDNDAAPYQLLSGTIKATHNSHRSLQGAKPITVAPGMPSGNTDTRYYWDLSKHIFRYNHNNAGNNTNRLEGGVHTVNEAIAVDAFVEMIRFFTTLILNADESKTL